MSDLAQRQKYPLEIKIKITQSRIQSWYEHYHGDVYVAFSGGWDSTVLTHIARNMYPNLKLVFANTGLEFDEIYDFVSGFYNVDCIRPHMTFKKTLEVYGYPIISKKIAMGITRYRRTKSDVQKRLRLEGGVNPTSGKKQYRTISKKWQWLLECPFKISDYCCTVMKKLPFAKYGRKTGRMPMTGEMASDSIDRQIDYVKHGCNAFGKCHPKSTPLGFWTKRDIEAYTKKYNVEICDIYSMGYSRTGCIYCMFGISMEGSPNRFQLMKKTHPQKWKYCMDTLGVREVMKYIGFPVE